MDELQAKLAVATEIRDILIARIGRVAVIEREIKQHFAVLSKSLAAMHADNERSRLAILELLKRLNPAVDSADWWKSGPPDDRS